MNAAEIVDILLEGWIDPEEFVNANPEMFATFTFHPFHNMFEVKRWEDGSYYYIGSVRQDPVDKTWYAHEVPPVGRRSYRHVMSDAPFRQTREQAAQDLWQDYKRELDTPIRVR